MAFKACFLVLSYLAHADGHWVSHRFGQAVSKNSNATGLIPLGTKEVKGSEGSLASTQLTEFEVHNLGVAAQSINVLYGPTTFSGVPHSASQKQPINAANNQINGEYRVAISTSSQTVFVVNEVTKDIPCNDYYFNHLFVHPIAQTHASTVNWNYTVFAGGGPDEDGVWGTGSTHNCSFTEGNRLRVFYLNLAMAPGIMFNSALVKKNPDVQDVQRDKFSGGRWRDYDTSDTNTTETMFNYLHYEEVEGDEDFSTCRKCALTYRENATGTVYYVFYGVAGNVQTQVFTSGVGLSVSCVTTTTCVTDRSSPSNENICFAGDSRVALESGEEKYIRDVKLGDRVRVATNDGELEYSPVIFLPHKENSVAAEFVRIQTVGGRILRTTKGHLILASSSCRERSEYFRADDLRVGMCVAGIDGHDRIESLEVVMGEGIYTMVTLHGDGQIVVDDIRVSSFGENHHVANTYYHIHRLLYHVLPHWLLGSDLITNLNLNIGDIAIYFRQYLF
mmetsp:Transcript_10186/g.19570  ORF Transcript_10186/g.19570 Transcript_10186/m.19570 type:complete len:505 (-) Transcript_10186:217-1731(-)